MTVRASDFIMPRSQWSTGQISIITVLIDHKPWLFLHFIGLSRVLANIYWILILRKHVASRDQQIFIKCGLCFWGFHSQDILLVYWESSNKKWSVRQEDLSLGVLKGSKASVESKRQCSNPPGKQVSNAINRWRKAEPHRGWKQKGE